MIAQLAEERATPVIGNRNEALRWLGTPVHGPWLLQLCRQTRNADSRVRARPRKLNSLPFVNPIPTGISNQGLCPYEPRI